MQWAPAQQPARPHSRAMAAGMTTTLTPFPLSSSSSAPPPPTLVAARAAPLLARPGGRRTGLAGVAAAAATAAAAPGSISSHHHRQQQQQWRHRRRRGGGNGVVAARAAAAAASGGGRGGGANGSSSSAGSAAASAAGSPAAAATTATTTNAPDASTTAACLAAASSVDESLVKTRFIAETLLPTRHGAFRLRGYKHTVDGGRTFTEPAAVICGDVEGKEDVPVRVHDACFTSEVLGSLKCDCAEQLRLALDAIHAEPPGMVIYLQQEGRGIGLANKIAAYALQEQKGLDTVDANRALGLPDDCREYTSVRNILRDLKVRSVRLMTNNPRKMAVLGALGVAVSGRVPCVVRAGPLNRGYLDAKQRRMAHLLTHEEEVEVDLTPAGASLPPVVAAISGDGAGVDEATAWAELARESAAKKSRDGGDEDGGDGGGGDAEGPYCWWGHQGEPSQPLSSDTALGGFGGAGSGPPGAHTVDEEVA